MTFLSLFAGIGGFDLGLARAGMRCVGQVEIDPTATSVLTRHFPEVPRHDDVRTTVDWWTAQPRPPLDLITGGFPCQDLSSMGRRAGLAGERSGLFFDLARCVAALRPRWVLAENVPGLLSSRQGADFETVLETLAELGYGLAWRVLDSQFFGVPQGRRRVFIAGRRGAPCPIEVLFEPGEDPVAPGAVAALPAPVPGAGGPGASPPRGPVFAISGGARRYPTLGVRVGGPSYTLDTGSDHRIAYPSDQPGEELTIRRLIPREWERLQGFPDDWTATRTDGSPISDTVRYRLVGNAVTVNVVEWIGARILQADIAARHPRRGRLSGAARPGRDRLPSHGRTHRLHPGRPT